MRLKDLSETFRDELMAGILLFRMTNQNQKLSHKELIMWGSI